jgi:nitrogen-specific signal transduction histidine kinase
VYKWYLPTLSEIMTLAEPDQELVSGFPAQQQIRAEGQWSGAVAALNQLLQRTIVPEKSASGQQQATSAQVGTNGNGSGPHAATLPALDGVLLSGPFPVLTPSELTNRIATWMFTVAAPGEILQLLPAADSDLAARYSKVLTLPLLPRDPLAAEQFCLVLTNEFSLAMVLGEREEGVPAFLFSFDPEVVWQVWRSLEARIKLAAPHMLPVLTRVVQQFPPVSPDYRLITQFSRLLLTHLPQTLDLEIKHPDAIDPVFQGVGKAFVAPTRNKENQPSDTQPSDTQHGATFSVRKPSVGGKSQNGHTKVVTDRSRSGEERVATAQLSSDAELLQAIAHEVRTPLTTIRTLTRLLLRRKDLNPDVLKRLEVIDRECTEQIDRFNLFFRAVELETTNTQSLLNSLAPISLDQVLQQNIPRWQQQASQHNHTLDIVLPQKMPLVVTDPTMLDQALTGLIDRITHSLPPGSRIQVEVSLAGHQLKLQLESHPQTNSALDGSKGSSAFGFSPTLKSLGQLLMFQPETGNISLNLAATKNLFQALGGKLIVRRRPEQGEIMTIFLPLDNRRDG